MTRSFSPTRSATAPRRRGAASWSSAPLALVLLAVAASGTSSRSEAPATSVRASSPAPVQETGVGNPLGSTLLVSAVGDLAASGAMTQLTVEVALVQHGRSVLRVHGVTGFIAHEITVDFEAAGALRGVIHRWGRVDGRFSARASCGQSAPAACGLGRVSADPTGLARFEGLELSGIDGTGRIVSSTLTGEVR